MIEQDVRHQLGEALQAVPSLSGRTYPWNASKLAPPAGIVDLPEGGDYDATYARGLDVIKYTVMVATGPVNDRHAAERTSAYVSPGTPESVKDALQRYRYTACDVVTVQSWQNVVAVFGGVSLLAVEFTVVAAGRGS